MDGESLEEENKYNILSTPVQNEIFKQNQFFQSKKN
jgi:hypothetical protein